MIGLGAFPGRKPGILISRAIARYVRSRSLSTWSGGTSIVSLTVCFSVVSTVVCICDQATGETWPRAENPQPEGTGNLHAMFEDELAFAHGLADAAARIALDHFADDGLEIRHKPDKTLVTAADTGIERMVRDRLATMFPGDRIMGEEEGGTWDGAGRVWIVDPIDGTANFARAIPVWATLIALQVDGEIVLGLANAPAMGERYAAVRGG